MRLGVLLSCFLVLFPVAALPDAHRNETTIETQTVVVEEIPELLFGTSGNFYRRLGTSRVWLGSDGKAIAPIDANGRFFTDGSGKIFARVGQHLADN